MAYPNTGMLGELFSPKARDLRAEEEAEERRLQFQAQDPFRAAAHAAYTGGAMAGKGLGTLAAGAMGRDARSPAQRNVDAVEAAKAQVSRMGFNPEDPKSIDQFYKQVIAILQKQGLVAEAVAVAKEWNAQKLATSKDKLAVEELERRKRRDLATDARAVERNAILAKKLGKAASPVGKLLDDMDGTTDPVRRAHLAKAVENATAGKVQVRDLGDRVELLERNPVTGKWELIREDDKGLTPRDEEKADDKTATAKQAYSEYMAGLQKQYNAAVELHNHRGVEGITGRWGRWVGEEKNAPWIGSLASWLSEDDARAALALHDQVTGGTFLAGLAKLKAASKTGATGLGAVSEREGDKVQSDAAALNRIQQAPDYRRQLATYIAEMQGFAARLADGAAADKIPAVPLQTKPLVAPRGGKRPAARPAAPAAPAPTPKVAPVPVDGAGDWTPEKERRLQELQRKQRGS
jgi:hypothetical protein